MDNQPESSLTDQADFAIRFNNILHRGKRLLVVHWWILLAAVLLAITIEAWLVSRNPPSFTSFGRMIASAKLSIPNANLYSEEVNSFFGTQAELMQSETVSNRAVLRMRSEKVEESPVYVSLKVAVSTKTSIFDLTATGPDTRYVQDYLQFVMEEYVNLKKELLANTSTAAEASLQKELNGIKAELQKSKDDLLNYQSKNNVVFLQQNGGNSAAEYLTLLNRKLTEKKSEYLTLENLSIDEYLERQEGAPNQPKNSPSGGQIDMSLMPNPTLANSQNWQNTPTPVPSNGSDNSGTRNELSSNDTPSLSSGFETAYLQTKQKILLLTARRTELIKSLAPTSTTIVGFDKEISYQKALLQVLLEQSKERMENRRHAMALEIASLESEIKEWDQRALDVSKKLSDFEAIKENQTRLLTAYDQIENTLRTVNLDKGVRQENVAIFEPATTATLTPRNWKRHLIMAALIGFVFGVGILLALDRLDDRPNSLTEVRRIFTEPVIGSIPLIKAKDKKSGGVLLYINSDQHALVEAFSNLRSGLLFMDSPKDHSKKIVVSSAVPGDGKSITCANLALSLAQTGAKVLLVDADLRCGVMHDYFQTSAGPGLAEVLLEKSSFSATMVQTKYPNLFLIPRGKTPNRPSDLLLSKIDQFLAQTEGQFDYCLFDAPPVMASDDVTSLAPHVGNLLMVIRAGETSARMAQAALDLLYLRNVNVIGLVFNGVISRTSGYEHYGYKKYFPENAVQ